MVRGKLYTQPQIPEEIKDDIEWNVPGTKFKNPFTKRWILPYQKIGQAVMKRMVQEAAAFKKQPITRRVTPERQRQLLGSTGEITWNTQHTKFLNPETKRWILPRTRRGIEILRLYGVN